MFHVEEIRKADGQIRFLPAVLESAPLRMKNNVLAAKSAPAGTLNEVNLSAFQLLVGWLSGFCGLGLLLWAFLKVWLVRL